MILKVARQPAMTLNLLLSNQKHPTPCDSEIAICRFWRKDLVLPLAYLFTGHIYVVLCFTAKCCWESMDINRVYNISLSLYLCTCPLSTFKEFAVARCQCQAQLERFKSTADIHLMSVNATLPLLRKISSLRRVRLEGLICFISDMSLLPCGGWYYMLLSFSNY